MGITVNNLKHIYGDQTVLQGISFVARSGRIVGFLGPNGAGKSTTMKILTGILSPTEGEVKVCGENAINSSKALRRRVGFLPESNPLYTDMYVHEYLYFMAGICKLADVKGRVSVAIEMSGLQTEQHKKIHQLSKGYKQRVGIAQAILHDPDVLILDEPTSGLDPNQLKDIRALIKQLGLHKTILLSTHIMQEVEAVCDDVIILHRGAIVADFPLQEFAQQYPGETLEQVFVRLTDGG